ncbi:hypothetical protein ACJ7VE_33700 [Streptomyces sp. PB17]|uniref:hypothetical protein n=1 Tax=Streptomyces sp. PB17 TaxID=3384158 RepID=UPI0038B4A2E2
MESGSVSGFNAALTNLAEVAKEEGSEGLTDAVRRLTPLLPGLAGDFAVTAVLAGALVEWGGSPLPLVDVLPRRATEAMMLNAAVPSLWESATRGRPLPEPESANLSELVRALTRRPWYRRSIDESKKEDLIRVSMAWFDMEDWLKSLIAVMVDDEFRSAVPDKVKAELCQYAATVSERSQRATWVAVLANVLDGEQVLVVDPDSRRGYVLTMSGISDNGQLYILLADRLIGDPGDGWVAGIRPSPQWVDAATSGSPYLTSSAPARTSFTILDGYGNEVSADGVPADITLLNGVRVLVLSPVRRQYVLNAGRMFERMRPTLSLKGILQPAETAEWFARLPPSITNET